jgi:hypothetical protein
VQEHRLIKKITEWKAKAFRRGGRLKVKWEDDVKQDARVIKCYYLKKQTESRNG